MPGVLKTVSPDGRGRGHYRIGDARENISTEEIVIAANSGDMAAGTVLGKVTASGQYAGYDPAALDGTEDPDEAIILYNEVADSAATQKAVGDVRDVAVNGNALTWPNAATANEKAAVEASMAVRSLLVRY
jgi:hypothetical protein